MLSLVQGWPWWIWVVLYIACGLIFAMTAAFRIAMLKPKIYNNNEDPIQVPLTIGFVWPVSLFMCLLVAIGFVFMAIVIAVGGTIELITGKNIH